MRDDRMDELNTLLKTFDTGLSVEPFSGGYPPTSYALLEDKLIVFIGAFEAVEKMGHSRMTEQNQ
jgi:hypothetical protein